MREIIHRWHWAVACTAIGLAWGMAAAALGQQPQRPVPVRTAPQPAGRPLARPETSAAQRPGARPPAVAQRPSVSAREVVPAMLLSVERADLPPPTPSPFGAHISFADAFGGDRRPTEQYSVKYFTTPMAANLPLVLVFDYRSADAPTAPHSIARRVATQPSGYLSVDVPIPAAFSPVLHWRATLSARGRVLGRILSADWPEEEY